MNNKHKRTKLILKISGISSIVVGIVLTIVGFVDFISTMINENDMPKLFWLMMIGIPLIGLGMSLTMFGFKKEISRYVKDETIPVKKETYYDVKPEVKDFVDTILKDKEVDKVVCKNCGTINDSDDSYCKKCGKELKINVCPKCGAILDEDSNFCQKCGTKIK